jgi:hypothetical protein
MEKPAIVDRTGSANPGIRERAVVWGDVQSPPVLTGPKKEVPVRKKPSAAVPDYLLSERAWLWTFGLD